MLTDIQIMNFINKVKFFDVDLCWEWAGYRNKQGYGCCGIKIGKIKFNKASRIAYYMAFGDFDKSLDVCHKCDNPSCVNPDHLFLGTASDNMFDMWTKGRRKRKTHCPKGHPYDEKNTRYYGRSRSCKTCDYARPPRGKKRNVAHIADDSAEIPIP